MGSAVRLRLGEGPAAFVEPSFDPNAEFEPLVPDDELLDRIALNPGLDIGSYGLNPAKLELAQARGALRNTLRQQQILVYQVASGVGVLAGQVGKAREALRVFDVKVDDLSESILATEALGTFVGQAANALAAVPIYGQIASAALRVAKFFVSIVENIGSRGVLRQDLLPADRYDLGTDKSLFNVNVRTVLDAGADWTPLFMPTMRGKLSARVMKNLSGQHVVAWGLGDGTVPRVVIDDRPLTKPWPYHYSEGGGHPFGNVDVGAGFMPGSTRITAQVQSTILEKPNLHRGHESLFDPRCGSPGKTTTVDVGRFYPTTSNGLLSLWAFVRQRSASMYCIDVDAALSAWEKYFDAIWEGVRFLWRNETWEGGYGCGIWQSTLADLVGNFTLGSDGLIGGALSWRPTRDTKLTDADDALWAQHNGFRTTIRPALLELKLAQRELLQTTPVAAYLPMRGPEGLGDQMAAFRSPKLAQEFRDARGRILNTSERNVVRVDDVLDDFLLRNIERRGGGTTVGDGGMGKTTSDDGIVDGVFNSPDGGDGGGGGLIVLAGLAAGAWGLRQYLRSRR